VYATNQGRYFLPGVGDQAVVVEILRAAGQALHFEELARRYNDQMREHSRKSVREVLNLLPRIPAVERVAPGVYRAR
jgi:Fe2+ or Zn2+ uptake regulation protein